MKKHGNKEINLHLDDRLDNRVIQLSPNKKKAIFNLQKEERIASKQSKKIDLTEEKLINLSSNIIPITNNDEIKNIKQELEIKGESEKVGQICFKNLKISSNTSRETEKSSKINEKESKMNNDLNKSKEFINNNIFKIKKEIKQFPKLPKISEIPLFSNLNMVAESSNVNLFDNPISYSPFKQLFQPFQNDSLLKLENINTNGNAIFPIKNDPPLSAIKSRLIIQNSGFNAQALKIDFDLIQNDLNFDPLFQISESNQNQNFINIYISKNQYPIYSPFQYSNDFSQKGTPMNFKRH